MSDAILKLERLKQTLDEKRPFSQPILDNLDKWFEVELTFTSNAIEGNTLTRAETALVLEKGLTVGGKPFKDHVEAYNHQEALSAMKGFVHKAQIDFNDILYLHKLILKGLDDTSAGSLRTIPVRISGSIVILPNPRKLPELIDDFMKWLQTNQEHPIHKAALAHYKLVSIHPFVDGNGRTARLLMNLILMQHGYPPAIITPKDRLKYIKSLEKAQTGGAIDDYLRIIYAAVRRSLEIYIKAIFQKAPEVQNDISDLLTIGQLAKAISETTATVRHWTKIGLLDVTTTTPSGYQLYESRMIERCKKVRELQKGRYTLEEIISMIAK